MPQGYYRRNFTWLFLLLFALSAAAGLFLYGQRQIIREDITAVDLTADKEKDFGLIWQNTRQKQGEALSEEYSIKSNTVTGGEFKTPEGFLIKSYSKVWTGNKLKEIYDELLRNGHGTELQYVSAVIIYPAAKSYQGSDILGTQKSEAVNYDVFLDFPAILPPQLTYSVESFASEITLYDMDSKETIEEAAKTIAHEYGHHFTKHYFFLDKKYIQSSDYYKIRGLAAYPEAKEYSDYDMYIKNYDWSILEMAAEDYVQILGSQNAKRTYDYRDVKELLTEYVRTNRENKNSTEEYYNAFPQNNIVIPLAAQVEGLEDYYRSFTGDQKKSAPAAAPNINLAFDKKSSHGYTYYEVRWDTVPDAVSYTLVCYTGEGKVFRPVKTTLAGEPQTAVIGTPSITSGFYIHYWSDGIPQGDKLFKVFVLLSGGRIVATDPIRKSF